MIVIIVLFLLLASFFVHIISMVFYFMTKKNSLFNIFFATSLTNILVGIALSILALKHPEMIRHLDLRMISWAITGFVMFLTLALKIWIFRNIWKRSKDPAFYHINYFGKKVYEEGLVTKYEFVAIFISLPFFLILGSYFVARLVNLVMYGHL